MTDRAEVLNLFRKRLNDEGSVVFSTGATVDTWNVAGAIGVYWPNAQHPRRTFGPRELGEAYDYAMGRIPES